MSNCVELEGLVHSKLKTVIPVWFSKTEALSLLAVLYKGKSESLETGPILEYNKLVKDIVDDVEDKVRPFAIATVEGIFYDVAYRHGRTYLEGGSSRRQILKDRAYCVLNKIARELELEQRKSSTKEKIAELKIQLKILKSSLADMDKA